MAKEKGSKRDISIRRIEVSAIRQDPAHPIDHENHRMWFRASTDQLCDDGIVILPEAWREDMPPLGLDVADNVPLLDSHDYWTIGNIIGAPVDFEIDKEGLLLLLDFAAAEPHPRGQMAWYLASEGYLKAGSVGWKTLAWEEGETDTGTKYDIVTRARLLEFSLCVMGMDNKALAVKGNPMAVAAARALSQKDEPEGEQETERVAEGEPDRIAEILEAVNALGESLEEIRGRLEFLNHETISTLDGVHNIDDGPLNPLARFLELRAERSELTGPEAMDALYETGRKGKD